MFRNVGGLPDYDCDVILFANAAKTPEDALFVKLIHL